MLAKYKIEFAIPTTRSNHRPAQPQHYLTDDPVACEEVLSELLERGLPINAVSHEGVPLPGPEFDRMIKAATGLLTSRQICRSLDIDSVEAHQRFGSPA